MSFVVYEFCEQYYQGGAAITQKDCLIFDFQALRQLFDLLGFFDCIQERTP